MKKISIILLSVTMLLCGCTDRIHFDAPFFVSIKNEAGAATSSVISTANNLVLQYPVRLVSSTRSEGVTVEFEVIPGNGLKEGVDYTLPASRKIVFEPGVYCKYIRVNYLKREVDESQDNTLTIRLVGISDSGIVIGYPGPNKKFSTHVVTKIND